MSKTKLRNAKNKKFKDRKALLGGHKKKLRFLLATKHLRQVYKPIRPALTYKEVKPSFYQRFIQWLKSKLWK